MGWHKYGAKKERLDGYSFASHAEAMLYLELKRQLEDGLWKEIRCQVSVYLTNARILYKPDFMTIDSNGLKFYHEMKGHETPSWRIKRRLWPFYGDADLRIYNFDHRNQRVKFKETLHLRVKK